MIDYRKPPCKVNGVECTKRHPACSSSCPEFIKWKAWRDTVSQRRKDDLEVVKTIDGRMIERNQSIKRRFGR